MRTERENAPVSTIQLMGLMVAATTTKPKTNEKSVTRNNGRAQSNCCWSRATLPLSHTHTHPDSTHFVLLYFEATIKTTAKNALSCGKNDRKHIRND